MFDQRDLVKAQQYIIDFFRNLFSHQHPLQKFVITKAFSQKEYANAGQLAHIVLLNRIIARDPGSSSDLLVRRCILFQIPNDP